jgi:hypothetical protein
MLKIKQTVLCLNTASLKTTSRLVEANSWFPFGHGDEADAL